VIISVSFDLEVPDDSNDEELEEWIEFNLNASGSMKLSNSFYGTDLDAFNVQVNT